MTDLRLHTKVQHLDEYQQKVVNCVENYKKLFPTEYLNVVNYLKERRKNLKTKFAETEAKTHGLSKTTYLERGIHEIPLTLHKMISLVLDVEGNMWFREKKTARWFVRKYKEFLSGEVD